MQQSDQGYLLGSWHPVSRKAGTHLDLGEHIILERDVLFGIDVLLQDLTDANLRLCGILRRLQARGAGVSGHIGARGR